MAPPLNGVLTDLDGGIGIARWVGCFEEHTPGWSRWDLAPDSTPRCVREFCVTGGYGLLIPAVVGAWWAQTAGLARYVMPHWDGVSDCERRAIEFDPVAWQYGLDETEPDWATRDLGFVKARSYDAHDREIALAALVPISTWAELIELVPVADQFNTSSYFAVPDGEAARTDLVRKLNRPAAPTPQSLLADPASSLMVVTQDDDRSPTLDSIVLAGRCITSGSAARQVEVLAERIDRCLTATARATTDHEWNRAVADLAGVAPR